MASDLEAVASNLKAMASNLEENEAFFISIELAEPCQTKQAMPAALHVGCHSGRTRARSQQQEGLQSQRAYSRPSLQGEGPRSQAETPSQGDPFIAGEASKLLLAWTQAFSQCTEDALLVDQLRNATKQTALFPAEIRQAFKDWQAQISKSEEITLQALVSFRTFWFQTGAIKNCSNQNAVLQIETTATLQDQSFVCYRPVYTPVIFAHLFSGHRRFADVQDCIEKKGYAMISW